MIEFASGIAGRTNQLVMAAKKENPSISVAGTRKHPRLLKNGIKSIDGRRRVPHRTGLSDTILIFREHLLFTGGYERLPEVIRSVKEKMKERKIVIEAHSLKEALIAAKSGADAVQMDKSTQEIFSECSGKCRAINPNICMIAAGAINDSNAGMYAKAGADVLVTSWMYFAPPADIMAEILPIDEY